MFAQGDHALRRRGERIQIADDFVVIPVPFTHPDPGWRRRDRQGLVHRGFGSEDINSRQSSRRIGASP